MESVSIHDVACGIPVGLTNRLLTLLACVAVAETRRVQFLLVDCGHGKSGLRRLSDLLPGDQLSENGPKLIDMYGKPFIIDVAYTAIDASITKNVTAHARKLFHTNSGFCIPPHLDLVQQFGDICPGKRKKIVVVFSCGAASRHEVELCEDGMMARCSNARYSGCANASFNHGFPDFATILDSPRVVELVRTLQFAESITRRSIDINDAVCVHARLEPNALVWYANLNRMSVSVYEAYLLNQFIAAIEEHVHAAPVYVCAQHADNLLTRWLTRKNYNVVTNPHRFPESSSALNAAVDMLTAATSKVLIGSGESTWGEALRIRRNEGADVQIPMTVSVPVRAPPIDDAVLCVASHITGGNTSRLKNVLSAFEASFFREIIMVLSGDYTIGDVLPISPFDPDRVSILSDTQNLTYDFGKYKMAYQYLSGRSHRHETMFVFVNDSCCYTAPLHGTMDRARRMMAEYDMIGMIDSYQREHHYQSWFLMFRQTCMDEWIRNMHTSIPWRDDVKEQMVSRNEVDLCHDLMKRYKTTAMHKTRPTFAHNPMADDTLLRTGMRIIKWSRLPMKTPPPPNVDLQRQPGRQGCRPEPTYTVMKASTFI